MTILKLVFPYFSLYIRDILQRMKKYFILPILGAILLILILIKLLGDPAKDSNAPKKSVPLVSAECYLVRDTSVVFNVNTVGSITANEKVDIVSEIARRVITVLFNEGNFVSKGQILFQLDDADYQASLRKIEAQLELARETEKRNASLLRTGGVSQQLYDEYVNKRKVLEAEEEALKVQIAKTKIRAPFQGRTGLRNVSPGAYVSPGQVLVSLEDQSSLKLDFSIPERQSNTIKKGQLVSFRMEGIPGNFKAEVEAIDPSVNSSTGNLRIMARIKNDLPDIGVGSSVSILINVKNPVASIYIPAQSLIATPAGYTVFTMKGGVAKVQKIKVGLRSETMVEIIEGLDLGDTLLVTGFMKLKPDVKVKIIKTW
jgi:membrane fusion protein (multidrug efflux system)